MSLKKAEQDATALLDQAWWEDPADERLPVDPYELARGLGIKVQETLLPSDQSGMITMQANGEAVIKVNALDHENRQRFTCAHEIGHYSQRRRDGSDKVFTDYRSTLAGLGVDPDEIYANQFAAALLMPARLVAKYHRREESVDRLAKRFQTSAQAMAVRLRNLGLE